MVKEDIVDGLKNAVEKGYSLQSSIQSFINAGYNADDVNEAARQVNMGIIGQIDNAGNRVPRVVMKDNFDSSLSSANALPALPENKKELYVSEPPETSQIKKLPTDGTSTLIDKMEKKKGIPGYLIALIVFFCYFNCWRRNFYAFWPANT